MMPFDGARVRISMCGLQRAAWRSIEQACSHFAAARTACENEHRKVG
jgi:hypothetical protein